ncbi:NAD(P)-binding protein [Teratosphaeria nubilosa]|uniref:NAD(P)-binding protein n=1 Tax=Teratosphaeria nubilosa TaxID=161662 RepID=A0A6G1L0S0_9PEZI|nr:NAD(P)-binding protein [Teratosphaeria nubilosa]
MNAKTIPYPSLTKTWHDKPYPALDPTRPELSAKGKVVAITGGGGAIGGAIALAFAKAGAKVAILGRGTNLLHETRDKVEKEVEGANVLCVHADISVADSLRGALGNVKKDLGELWCLVANAGYLPELKAMAEAEEEEWWKGFEVNVKGAFHTARAFPSVAAKDAILVDISAGLVHIPAMPNASSYVSSKLAATKIYETLGREHPSISVIHIHPGVVKSELNLKAGMPSHDDGDSHHSARPPPAKETLTDDAVNLPGQFVVWAASEEAKGFRGKFLWCNWDVEELVERMREVEREGMLTVGLTVWPGQECEPRA